MHIIILNIINIIIIGLAIDIAIDVANILNVINIIIIAAAVDMGLDIMAAPAYRYMAQDPAMREPITVAIIKFYYKVPHTL